MPKLLVVVLCDEGEAPIKRRFEIEKIIPCYCLFPLWISLSALQVTAGHFVFRTVYGTNDK